MGTRDVVSIVMALEVERPSTKGMRRLTNNLVQFHSFIFFETTNYNYFQASSFSKGGGVEGGREG